MSFQPDIADITQALRLAVAPVFLLTGIGAILTVITRGLAPDVDRAPQLRDVRHGGAPEDRDDLVRESGMVGSRRCLACRAEAFAVFSEPWGRLLVALALVGAAAKLDPAPVVAGLLVLALPALIVMLLILLREIMLSVTSVRRRLTPP